MSRKAGTVLGEVTTAGSAGGAGLRDASDHLKRSIAIFEEVGNEVELARSCRAYAELLRQTPEHAEGGSRALTANFIELLDALIGKALATRLLGRHETGNRPKRPRR